MAMSTRQLLKDKSAASSRKCTSKSASLSRGGVFSFHHVFVWMASIDKTISKLIIHWRAVPQAWKILELRHENLRHERQNGVHISHAAAVDRHV